MKVKVAALGNSAEEVEITNESPTVQDALDVKGIKLRTGKKGDQILLNGSKVTNMGTRIAGGAVITVVPKVKGGSC